MKARIIILIAISAVLTLSFTIVSVKTKQSPAASTNVKAEITEPAGGLVSQESL